MNCFELITTSALNKESAEAKNILLDKILSQKHFLKYDDFIDEAACALWQTYRIEEAESRCKLIDLFLSNKDFNSSHLKTLGSILRLCNHEEDAQNQYEVFDKVINANEQNLINNLTEIVSSADKTEKTQAMVGFIDKIENSGFLFENQDFMKQAPRLIMQTYNRDYLSARIEVIDFVENNEELRGKNLFIKKLPQLLENITNPQKAQVAIDFLEKILKDDSFFIEKNQTDNLAFTIPQIITLVNNKDENIDYSTIKKLYRTFGCETTSRFSENDTKIACRFFDLRNKTSTNELTAAQKKDFLKRLIASNEDLFKTSTFLEKELPLLPSSKKEYCTLLPALVKSLGIEVKLYSKEEISQFNKSLTDFSSILEKMQDDEFNNLEINQEYSKDEFIKDIFSILKNMNANERQKVYDYYGFELYKNNRTKTGFSIAGYPVNLNNGKKLSRIENPKTRQTIEKLRPFVIRFSQNNKIISNNPEIEKTLNKIVEFFPELRTQINKFQHKTQDFDLFKHSIKTMQKIIQNPNFKALNDSDKKILLLGALFHDSNKAENYFTPKHSQNSAFDAFYITKKLNLTQEEQIKLHTLIKSHEWLSYINNSAITPEEKEKRQKNIAFDLQYDNFFKLMKILTIADLKAVKEDNEFYEKYKNILETESKIVQKYINELKTTRPLLPVTKFPNAARIAQEIKFTNKDGSTNLKGIYKDKDRLIVIKFNEVENETWEKIGFEKGTISKGIETTTSQNAKINTGNLKFFAHGLEYANQLARFDAFSLIDSDALLSVSYAECPEEKYRFFRTQGVILDADTKFIHGGGDSDSGSGYGKNIQTFKDNYIFNGLMEKERIYISNLIKKTLDLNDEEYVKFIEKNQNKSFEEIEPKQTREKLIRAFAQINSNKRKGERSYNEMFISNPKNPMAVFAYESDPKKQVGNPLEFLNNIEYKIDFLREYALEHDVSFVVFGD